MRGRDAGLSEHASHGAVMHMQLPRERTDRPAFGVMQPQDLGLEFPRDHRRTHCVSAAELSTPRPPAQLRPRRKLRTTERAASVRLASGTARRDRLGAVRIGALLGAERLSRYAHAKLPARVSLMRHFLPPPL